MKRFHLYYCDLDESDEGELVAYAEAESELATLRAEVEKLRADVLFVAKKAVFVSAIHGNLVSGYLIDLEVPCDGTYAGILSAVRRAGEGELR